MPEPDPKAARTLAPEALGPTICAGEILVEVMATTPGHGFLQPQPLIGPFASGAPAIFASQCGRFGGSAALIGAVGDDDFGQMNLQRLRADGVDVNAVAVDADWPTGSAFVRYRPDGSRDFIFNIAHSAAARFGWSPQVAALSARAGHLHVMGSALGMAPARAVILQAAALVLARGGSISVDPNLRKELAKGVEAGAALQQLIDMAAVVLPSGDELFQALGRDAADEPSAVAGLLARGVAEVVIKRGRHGASAHHRQGAQQCRGFAVSEIDATGAGDCFGAAYITSRRLGLSVAAALDYGCAAGARNVTVQGPMEGAGSRAELDAFIQTTARRPS